jgi:glycosyltransferase involved in cell wall biosynthesis
VTERYYNPGGLFEEVHILLINDDQPVPSAIQPTVGDARLFVHNLPTDGTFKRSLLWRPRLLRSWASGGVRLAREINPALVRCHGAHLNAYVASEIKRKLGIPYVISMHTNPDVDVRRFELRRARRARGGLRRHWRELLPLWASLGIERTAIRRADCVVCAYRFIEPYARRRGAKRVEVIYNAVCPEGVERKASYELSDPPRVVVPGRQTPGKDPSPVLTALPELADAELFLVGDGPLHDGLHRSADDLGIADRCHFVRAVRNEELCRHLRDYDVLVSVNDFGGVSKVDLEAAHVGMPVITNEHPLEARPEVLGENCLVVTGDAASYRDALTRLLGDSALRGQLGTQLRDSVAQLAPQRMEAAWVNLYRAFAAGD